MTTVTLTPKQEHAITQAITILRLFAPPDQFQLWNDLSDALNTIGRDETTISTLERAKQSVMCNTVCEDTSFVRSAGPPEIVPKPAPTKTKAEQMTEREQLKVLT